MSELKYWVWLSSLPGLSPASKARLPRRLGGVKETYFARAEDYERLDFLTPREREALENKGLGFANRAIEACLEGNIDIVTIGDANYPARLREIDAPPLVLYVRGRLPDIDELCAVAVVGTRDASLYGLRMAHNMGYGLTKCGALVVSGLTRGIDETAARGALQAGGGCVGVLGTPIDAVRPYAGIAYDVSLAGALVSEYAPGTPFSSRFFRERNRITSGLAAATLVVEAPAKSGALLFVSEALEQGREVFAVPGNADSARSEGSNRLIMEGAQPALTAWDILSGFAWRFPSAAAVDVVALVDEYAHQPRFEVALVAQRAPLFPRLFQAALHRVLAVALFAQDRIAYAIQRIGKRDDLLRKLFARHGTPPSF